MKLKTFVFMFVITISYEIHSIISLLSIATSTRFIFQLFNFSYLTS